MKKKENQSKSELDFILGDENNSSESRIEVTGNGSDEQVNFDTSSYDVDEIVAATSYKNTEPEEEKVYISNVRKITPKADGEYDDFEDGYDGETAAYIRALNGLNQRLLVRAAAAVTMKDGQPFAEKGELNEII